MTEARRRDAVVRMATDPDFADRLRADPAAIAAEYDLDEQDLAVLQGLREDAEPAEPDALGQRLSKSSLFFGGAGGNPTHDAGTAGLLKCDGHPVVVHGDLPGNPVSPAVNAGLLCDLVHPTSHGADAGLVKCNGVPVVDHVPVPSDPGPGTVSGHVSLLEGKDNPGLLPCNGIHPTESEGAPAKPGSQ